MILLLAVDLSDTIYLTNDLSSLLAIMNALKTFEKNISSTDLFTARVHALSTYLKPAKPELYPKHIPAHVIKFVSFDEDHFDRIFEVGFIGLFANFEYFMYDFLRELYTKYPKAIPLEKTIKAEDILAFKDYKSVRDFLIDSIAIENSYDIDVWNNVLQKLFNIRPISDDARVRLLFMNSVRNLLLHSGGHWNSKAIKDTRKINKAFQALGQPTDENSKFNKFKTHKTALTPQTAYSITLSCFKEIILDMKSQLKTKSRRTRESIKKKS